jgi:hypothetical protein
MKNEMPAMTVERNEHKSIAKSKTSAPLFLEIRRSSPLKLASGALQTP